MKARTRRPKGPPDEQGQALTEYALILLVVAAGLVTALTLFGAEVAALLQDIVNRLP